jgi:peptide deformylase
VSEAGGRGGGETTAEGEGAGEGRANQSSVSDRLAGWSEAELGVEGRVRDVVRAPAAVLSTAGARVDPTSAEIVRLAADLVATMRVSPGCVGLAAPQVGEGVRVFCVDVSAHPKTRAHHGTFVLCNAEVVEASRNEKAREGCMSVPDLTGDVKRPTRVVVRGELPGTGEEVTVAAEAFEARALQHEIDHCAGLLFLDRAAGAHAIHPRKTYL